MKRIGLTYSLLYIVLVCFAQTRTSTVSFPLSPVPADSVQIQDFFWYGQIVTSSHALPGVKAQTYDVQKKEIKKTKKLATDWSNRIQHLDATGAVKDELEKDGELRSALKTVRDGHKLFLLTGESKYIDAVERAYYNGICGWQEADDKTDAALAAQTLTDIPGHIFATSGEHLYLNMYVRSEAHVKTEALDMKVLTMASTPWYNQAALQFLFQNKDQHMVLHLRLPNWLGNEILPSYQANHFRAKFAVWVNGIQQKPDAVNGYIEIDRIWNDTDIVQISIPTPIRRLSPKEAPNQVILQKGALLYTILNSQTPTGYIKQNVPIKNQFDKDRHTETLKGKLYDSSSQEVGEFFAEPYCFNRKNKEARLLFPFLP